MAETKDLVIEWWLVAMVCGCEGRKRGCDIVPDSIHFLYSLALGNSISTCNRHTDTRTPTHHAAFSKNSLSVSSYTVSSCYYYVLSSFLHQMFRSKKN